MSSLWQSGIGWLCFYTKYWIISWAQSKRFVELFSEYPNNAGVFNFLTILGYTKLSLTHFKFPNIQCRNSVPAPLHPLPLENSFKTCVSFWKTQNSRLNFAKIIKKLLFVYRLCSKPFSFFKRSHALLSVLHLSMFLSIVFLWSIWYLCNW